MPKVNGRKKTLVQSLKQFHSHYYQLYQKGMTHTMVSLQGLYSGDALRCPNISAGVGLKSFCPWCLKLSGNPETITIHLWKVHYWMAIWCDICWAFAGMSMQNVLDHQMGCKGNCNKMHVECKVHGKAPKSHKKKKSKSWEPKGTTELLGSDAAKKSCWVECHSMSFPLPPSQSSEQMLVLSLNHSGSLWIHFWVIPCSVRWTVLSFLLVIFVVI